MKKYIAEELPARKFPQSSIADKKGRDKDENKSAQKTPEEKIRQAVYDIRYRARREDLPLRQAYSQYMQNSSMSEMEKTEVRNKLFGKSGGIQAEDFKIEELVIENIANAMFKVFVENNSKNKIDDEYLKELNDYKNNSDRKYKVRVTDKNGTSYIRYANRQKINDLRSNPNIESVEMTEYGEPYEGEKTKGEQTRNAKSGKKLDPVGKEDKDIDNDGDHDKTDRYLQNRRDVRGAAINQRKKIGEEFFSEVKKDKKNENKKYDVMKGKNKIIVSPNDPILAHNELEGELIFEKAVSKSQQRFMGMVYAAKKGQKAASPEVAAAAKSMSAKEAKKFAKTKHKGLPTHKEECECQDEKEKGDDLRSIPTKVNLVKNKLRSMGLKMSYEPEGQVIDERRREEKGTPRKPRDKAFEIVAKSMGTGRVGVEPRGKKKVPGKKPPAAGERGSERRSPEQIVKHRRTEKQKSQDLMHSRFD
jgi:hypothetical protein